MGGRPYAAADQGPADRREDRFRAPPDNIPATTHHAERPSPRDVEADRLSQPYMNGPGERRSRFDLPIPSPSDRMEVDVLPASRMVPTRGITGGMHADRMVAEPPRGPRAMAPRDGPGAGYSVSPNAPGVQPVPARYNARGPPAPEPVIPTPGRGRVRLGQPEGDRRWEPHDSVRRPSYSAPSPAGPLDPPPRRADAGMGVPRDFLGDRRDDRVPPPRISGTNNIPIGAKSSSYASDQSASNVTRSPVDRYRPANDQGDLPRRPPPAEPDSYDRRRLPLPEIPPSGLPRNDRAGRRLSLGHDGPLHARGSEPISDRPGNALPPRPRDDIPPRQSRFGPSGPSFSAPPDDQPRIWQTRDEAQSARAQDRPIDVRPPRDEVRPLREGDWDARAEPPPPRRWAAGDSYVPSPSAPESMESRTRAPEVRNRPLTPPPVDAVRRSDEPLVEHPVVGKLHPERARWLSVQAPTPPGDADRSSKGNRTRRSGRSPGRGYGERMQSGDSGRDLPPRSADDTRLPPLRERSPIPLQNGHRPDIKRGGSLLDRLSLNDTAPTNDGGSSLRDRVGLAHESNEEVAIAQVADQMEVDAEGSGYTDDGQKGSSRGLGRRRGGKSRRFRRN
ncbi:hypothetical protein BD414DRAFT_223491 [Trametes punicea]|nr:hypothetical protein BD414DRAFT_223491 [Trametes punicea]